MANGLNLEAEMVIMALAVVPDKVTAIQQCPTDHTEIQQVSLATHNWMSTTQGTNHRLYNFLTLCLCWLAIMGSKKHVR